MVPVGSQHFRFSGDGAIRFADDAFAVSAFLVPILEQPGGPNQLLPPVPSQQPVAIGRTDVTSRTYRGLASHETMSELRSTDSVIRPVAQRFRATELAQRRTEAQ